MTGCWFTKKFHGFSYSFPKQECIFELLLLYIKLMFVEKVVLINWLFQDFGIVIENALLAVSVLYSTCVVLLCLVNLLFFSPQKYMCCLLPGERFTVSL